MPRRHRPYVPATLDPTRAKQERLTAFLSTPGAAGRSSLDIARRVRLDARMVRGWRAAWHLPQYRPAPSPHSRTTPVPATATADPAPASLFRAHQLAGLPVRHWCRGGKGEATWSAYSTAAGWHVRIHATPTSGIKLELLRFEHHEIVRRAEARVWRRNRPDLFHTGFHRLHAGEIPFAFIDRLMEEGTPAEQELAAEVWPLLDAATDSRADVSSCPATDPESAGKPATEFEHHRRSR